MRSRICLRSLAYPLSLCLAWLLMLVGLPQVAATETVSREGFVSLQFDDGNDYDFNPIYWTLEQHGLKGTFGVITERSDLGLEGNPSKIQQMYQSGHEIQDHTTRHDYMWATHVDTLDDGIADWIEYTFATMAQWDSLCDRSLFILDSLGIDVSGWNQPGGSGGTGTIPGHRWWSWRGMVNDSLYELIATKYTYAIGYGVHRNTAHLNLRGHNYPDRYPLFNVPHRTIDSIPLADIKREIADDVASGLWDLSAAHLRSSEAVAKVTDLIEWIDQKQIPVLLVRDGVNRICYGRPDPMENQFPQADMLTDLDGNGKPDGFTGSCALDTLTASPVDSAWCMKVFGDCDFFCYGPESGRSAFSIWAVGTDTSQLRISYQVLDFDWNSLDSHVGNWMPLSTSWTKIDSAFDPALDIYVDSEADRIRFTLSVAEGETVLVAYPELRLHGVAGLTSPEASPEGLFYPNPVVRGALAYYLGKEPLLYDVVGRRIDLVARRSREDKYEILTSHLAPGIYFIRPRDMSRPTAKIVILR